MSKEEELFPLKKVLIPFTAILVVFMLVAVYFGVQREPEITPNDEFFTNSIKGTQHVDRDSWRLSVSGEVENPMVFTYSDLLAMPETSIVAKLQCVEGPSGTANWTGVRISYILDLVNITDSAREVVFYAADGYSSSLTIKDASKKGYLLAWEMNGEELPARQGFPIRVVAPGKYGYKWVMWVERIEVVDHDYKGYWESRGWDDDADVTIYSNWQTHVLILVNATILGLLGTVTGIMSRRKGLDRTLRRARRRAHVGYSLAFMVVVLPTYVYWTLTTYTNRGEVFYTPHGVVSLASITLLLIGMTCGLASAKGKGWGRKHHFWTSTTGFILYIFTLAMGAAIVWL